ncbi:hypothetical protein [Nocardia jejuensis]|uniref:hypothetical protein n=1 Tax=Nocardia jejuensis TaxID=328049 RepID=UPI000834E2C6|nr:hypothetical protein [Nocardia jejuensis]
MSLSRTTVAAAAAAVLGSICWQFPATALADTASVAAAQAPEAAAPAPVAARDLWTVPAAPADSASLIVAYSFGNRIPAGVDPARTVGEPGPVNAALASTVMAVRGDRDLPVYAQTEIAEVLKSRYGLTDVITIDPRRDPDGTLVYLSTDGVAAEIAALRGSAVATDRAAVVAFGDHLWRATATTAEHGFDAFAPQGIPMPNQYDPESGQLWTRSPLLYLPTDFAGRLALL